MQKFILILTFLLSTANAYYAATYTVTNNNDASAGSLRQAIIDANANAGADNIHFNIPSASVAARTISPTSVLPDLTGKTIIDGTTQPLGNAFGTSDAKIILDGTSAGGVHGITLAARSCEVYGMCVQNLMTE